MSEYWKSNPRKFCDFCKCWIADNKPSVEFHERGKRHKENVQKRLAEMGRKGQEAYEAQQQEDDFLRSMEEAALKAYKTDIEHNPDMTGTKISEIAKSSNAEIVVGQKKKQKSKAQDSVATVPGLKTWYEAKSDEGQSYYWNIESGESVWEKPKGGFLSIEEQEKMKQSSSSSDRKTTTKSRGSSTSAAPAQVYGPAPRVEAFSSWQSISQEPTQQGVDLQLPETEEVYYGPEVSFKRPEVSFKEKTVTLSAERAGGGGTVEFKKRKAFQDNKKIMKRRNDL